MKLAFELGFPSVDRMLGCMTSREVAEWKAYFRVEAEDERTRTMKARVQGNLSRAAASKGIRT